MYVAFPIDNRTGQELSELDVQQRHYEKVCLFSLLARHRVLSRTVYE